jgi:hypothetical protein
MIHKLTKFQKGVWEKIKPLIREEFDSQITFDDELQIKFDIENGKVIIEIFPKDEVLLHVKFESEGFEKYFFNSSNLESLTEILKKNEYQ